MARAPGVPGRRPRRALIEAVEFEGIERSRPTPEVADALGRADAIVIGPSNPVISIGPILAVPGMRDAMRDSAAPVVAVSPFVAGRAIKGQPRASCRRSGTSRRATASRRRTVICSTGWSSTPATRPPTPSSPLACHPDSHGRRPRPPRGGRAHAGVCAGARRGPMIATAILPVKRFGAAKQRLAPCSAPTPAQPWSRRCSTTSWRASAAPRSSSGRSSSPASPPRSGRRASADVRWWRTGSTPGTPRRPRWASSARWSTGRSARRCCPATARCSIPPSSTGRWRGCRPAAWRSSPTVTAPERTACCWRLPTRSRRRSGREAASATSGSCARPASTRSSSAWTRWPSTWTRPRISAAIQELLRARPNLAPRTAAALRGHVPA